jgi:ArsR family transcriptional regulator, virulence genes transcriptional regulator
VPDFITDRSMNELESRANEAAGLLKALANEKRLMILCKILEHGEMSVMPLAAGVGLSQSALSQHLARMREEGIIAARRDGQAIFYHLADPKVGLILKTLKSTYC